jgi:uncharacterized protein YjbI with pentapeptide repeats
MRLLRYGAGSLTLIGPIALVWWYTPSSVRVLAVAIAVFLVLVTVCVLLLPSWLVSRDTALRDLSAEQRASAVNGARTTLVQTLVGLAALAGIFVGWQQLQIDREQSRTDRRQLTEQLTLTRQGQVAERFTRAVDQLGSTKLEQRLGGIYGLERIALDSSEGDIRLVINEVLTAYVRRHAPYDPKAVDNGRPPSKPGPPEPDVHAAMTVLGRRTVMATDPGLNLRNVDLGSLDLRGLDFRGANLSFSYLRLTNLSGAKLQKAHLHHADLQVTNLTGAELQGANLGRSNLQGTNFEHAQLQKANLAHTDLRWARLNGARLQEASLNDAQLWQASLWGAQLQKANLNLAHLWEVRLVGAQLQGADLSRAGLQGAILLDANLQGARLDRANCNSNTRWPDGFDWKAAGVRLK